MAFCNKLGSLVRQSFFQNGRVEMASMLNSIRWMSSHKLLVHGLNDQTDDQALKDAFSKFGEVVSARVLTDRHSGRSRGCGVVQFTNDESANLAISEMDDKKLPAQNIRVRWGDTFQNLRVGILFEAPPGTRFNRKLNDWSGRIDNEDDF